MRTLTAAIFATLMVSTAVLADHTHKGHGDLVGNWLATFNLVSAASGCPVDVQIPVQFNGGKLTGDNGRGETLSAKIDAHKIIKGYFAAPEGFPDFQASYDGTKFSGTWEAIGFCEGTVAITRTAK